MSGGLENNQESGFVFSFPPGNSGGILDNVSGGSGGSGKKRLVGIKPIYVRIKLPPGATIGPEFCGTSEPNCDPCETDSCTGYYYCEETCEVRYAQNCEALSLFPACGSGNSNTVQTECCPNPLPTTMNLSFTGSLSALGTVPVTWNGTAWVATGLDFCGATNAIITLTCYAGGFEFVFADGGSEDTCELTATADMNGDYSCSPVTATGSGMLSVSQVDPEDNCTCFGGSFTVTLSV